MSPTYTKILVIVLLFLGEALAIYAEMFGARSHSIASQPFMQIFLKMFLIFIVGGGLLIAGYMLGYSAFKNIWVVSAISITSILLVEPFLAWITFQQLPTTGAAIGIVLGAIGLLVTLLV